VQIGQPLEGVFVGREAQLAQVAGVMARVEKGRPWLVVIEGDPGIGKTALARRSLAEATGFQVLSVRADQTEADLDFGLVDQLLRAAGAVLPAFPPAGGNGSAASSFAVGARLVEMVGEQQTTGPLALLIDDLQWADRKSLEAMTFMLRRLYLDHVIAIVTYRGPSDRLDDAAQRMLLSMENRLRILLGGLSQEEVAALAAALTAGPLDDQAARRLHRGTGGHPLYLRTVLSEGFDFDRTSSGSLSLPRSLTEAIGDHLRVLPPQTRAMVEMLSVLNSRLPLAQLGQAAGAGSPGAAVEPAVSSGLVDWSPDEPTCPVAIRHSLVRDAVYSGIAVDKRRRLHARAASVVSESASWKHRVASLDRPDEGLAADLERLAGAEAAGAHLALAATHLQWASDISPLRADRERRLLTAALHLTIAEEARGMALRPAVEELAPSPLRDCVLGTMEFSSGHLADARVLLSQALAQARNDPDSELLAAVIAGRLAIVCALMGDAEQVQTLGRWALGTDRLDGAAASITRTVIAVGVCQLAGPRAGLAELGHLAADPARVGPVDVDALSFRGRFRLLAGDLDQAIADLTASLKMVHRGATITGGQRAYFYLALAQYLSGAWDDVLLTAEQGFCAAAIHTRRFDLPMLHLAAGCVPAARGQAEEAGRHARLAEEEAASLDYGQERVYAAMARALVCQAAGNYVGMADALGGWQSDAALDDRGRADAVFWLPLLAEGLIGSGRFQQAAPVLHQIRAEHGEVGYLQPAVAWLEGWLAQEQGRPERAEAIYQHGEDTTSTQSPVHTARLLLAHGSLLRRTGHRKAAIERLRRAAFLYHSLRAEPFSARAEAELAACDLPGSPAKRKSVLTLTTRETEVAHLVGKGLSNPEVAGELFVSRKAVEYHLGNIYSKCGLQGRQELRRYVEQWGQPATI
jgi:ATP/maltotriose-dependent transcriptional regulator MalT